LEGTDVFYNCEIGAGFLKAVAQRGPWNRKLRNVSLEIFLILTPLIGISNI